MNDHELNAGLRVLIQERTRLSDVPSVRQQILATPIEQMPQQRRWLPLITTGRFQTMFSATKFVVAGVIVALAGGFLLAGVLTTQRIDESLPVGASVSPKASPVVTDVIDVGGFLHGPIVSAGDAVWVAGGTSPLGSVSRGSVSRIDPVTREVTDTFAVGSDPSSLVPTEDALWVLGFDGTLSRIDLDTRAVTKLVGVFDAHPKPLVTDGSLWVQRGSGSSASLVEIDLAGQAITNEYTWPWDDGADWIAEIDGAIWARGTTAVGSDEQCCPRDDHWLARFDLDARKFTYMTDAYRIFEHADPFATHDAIWWNTGENRTREVERFDVELRAVTDTLALGPTIGNAIVAERAIWVPQGDSVHRIDLRLREVSDVIPVGSEAWDLAYADGAIWVVSRSEETVSRIDPETREVTHTIEVGGSMGTPLAFDGAIWVPTENGTVTRIATGAATE